jgi:hypothetical protein
MKRSKCWPFLLSSLVTPFLWAQNGDPPSVTKLHCVERAKDLSLCEGLAKGKTTDEFLIACLENVRKPALSAHEKAANIFREEKDDAKDPKQAETATYWLSDCMETYVNELELYRAQLKAELEPLVSDTGTASGTEQQSEEDADASTKQAQKLTADIKVLNVRLDCLRAALRLHAPNFLFQDHRAFRPWIGRFALGAEYASLNDVPDGKVFPRASLLIYRSSDTWRKRQWAPNLYLDILLTSNEQRDFDPKDPTSPPAEESDDEEEEEEEDPPVESEEPSRSLEARGGLFWPLVKFGDTPGHERWLQEEFGPIVEYRIGYIDEQDRVDRSFYGGLRLASSPQFFVDLLYGNAESSSADRIELRGQMPVTMLKNGTRLHMGLVANLKAEKADVLKTDPAERLSEPDLVKIYFTWDVDFDRIFGWFSGGKSKS